MASRSDPRVGKNGGRVTTQLNYSPLGRFEVADQITDIFMRPIEYISQNIFFCILIFLNACDIFIASNNDPQFCNNTYDLIAPSSYSNPVWHPNGKYIGFNHTPLKNIVYISGTQCIDHYEFYSDSLGFWLIDSNGMNQRRILPYYLQTPVWSPDGEWIAFVSNAQIYKMRFNGTMFDTNSIVQLTYGGRSFFPTWSPDGKWIAYDSDISSPNGMKFVWKMKSDGSHKYRIAYDPSKGEIRMPHWSSDGKIIVHIRYVGVGSPEIFIMDSSGNNPQRITNNTLSETYPQLSLNNTIAYVRDPVNIWLMNVDGTEQRQISTDGVDADYGKSFSWSPEGKKIVYTSYRTNDWSYSNGVLKIIDVTSGNVVQLTFN